MEFLHNFEFLEKGHLVKVGEERDSVFVVSLSNQIRKQDWSLFKKSDDEVSYKRLLKKVERNHGYVNNHLADYEE